MHGDISIRKLKTCGSSIHKPLKLTFNQHMEAGAFFSEWKKGILLLYTEKETNKN